MAIATSTQWSEFYRGTFPGFCASDIVQRTAVSLATNGDWQVQMVAGASVALVPPLGIARDDADQGHSVTVFDENGSVIRVTAGATVAQRQAVAPVIAGATNYAHPITGLTATVLFFGPAVVASGSATFKIGDALEEANPGEQFALRVNVAQLGGLS